MIKLIDYETLQVTFMKYNFINKMRISNNLERIKIQLFHNVLRRK